MFQTQVTVMDAVVVVTLMESSMLSAALISADNALHSTFPQEPMKEYRFQGCFTFKMYIHSLFQCFYVSIAELVLNRLGLKDILLAEMERLEVTAARPAVRWQNESLVQVKDQINQRDHIAQTQKILANIRRFNQEQDDAEKDQDQPRSNPEKKRKTDDGFFQSPKKPKRDRSASHLEKISDRKLFPPIDTVQTPSSYESETQSVFESPPISSTRIEPEKSIFMFSQGEDDDDFVFDV